MPLPKQEFLARDREFERKGLKHFVVLSWTKKRTLLRGADGTGWGPAASCAFTSPELGARKAPGLQISTSNDNLKGYQT